MENWFLIIIMVVVGLLTIGASVYILIAFQHPEDRNQAWLPKIVVCFGICVAIWTVLLFPLDVANVNACSVGLPLASCSTTLPMKTLWYIDYIIIVVMAFAIIPFAMFYYEGDSEWCVGRRLGWDGCACGGGAALLLAQEEWGGRDGAAALPSSARSGRASLARLGRPDAASTLVAPSPLPPLQVGGPPHPEWLPVGAGHLHLHRAHYCRSIRCGGDRRRAPGARGSTQRGRRRPHRGPTYWFGLSPLVATVANEAGGWASKREGFSCPLPSRLP